GRSCEFARGGWRNPASPLSFRARRGVLQRASDRSRRKETSMNRSVWTVLALTSVAAAVAVAWRGGLDVAPLQAAANPVNAAKTALFNGKDLSGWVQYLPENADHSKPDPAKTWSVKDGVIHCAGTPIGYLRTEKTFKNYFLVVEWRWPATPGNSGVLLHMQREDHVWPLSVEAQLESGNAGDFWMVD